MRREHSTRPHSASASDWEAHRALAGVADALLVFLPALSLVKPLALPLLAHFDDFVSAITRTGFEPFTNYVQFALCASAVFVAFFLGYRRGSALLVSVSTLFQRPIWKSRSGHIALKVLFAAGLFIYLVNVTSVTLNGPLTDAFHEGEYLGFVPVIAAGKGVLASTFLTHGPGVDLLPGFIAVKFANPENGIVATRFAYAGLRTVAVVAAFLAVVAFTRLVVPESSRARYLGASLLAIMLLVIALHVGSWPDVPTFHKTMNARDAGFLLQVFTVFVFARTQRDEGSAVAALAIAALIGVSLPWGVFYCYDRGLYGVGFVVLASLAFIACGGAWMRNWLIGLSSGAALGVALLYATFGNDGIAASFDQVTYWIHYGRAIWSYAGVLTGPDTLAGVLLAGSFIALALGAAHVLRVVASARTLRDAVRGEIGVVLMMAASIVCLRTAIERGDVGHVAWGVTASWIMLCVFIATSAMAALAPAASSNPRAEAPGKSGLGASIVMIAVSAVVGWSLLFLDPYAAYQQLIQYHHAFRTNDDKILSSQQASTLGSVRDDLRSSSCFYTLTSEAAWYYLFQKESCSRFYELTNARAISAQREIVATLNTRSPAVILFGSGGWSSAGVDGVSPFNASPLVIRYVLQHYVPDKLVAENWFWRRSDEPLRFGDRSLGKALRVPSKGTPQWDLQIAGTYGDERVAPPKALYVTDGNENTPIWAGRPAPDEYILNRWSAWVPTAWLAPGLHRIRVWALPEDGVPMLRLGDDIELRIEGRL